MISLRYALMHDPLAVSPPLSKEKGWPGVRTIPLGERGKGGFEGTLEEKGKNGVNDDWGSRCRKFGWRGTNVPDAGFCSVWQLDKKEKSAQLEK